MTGPVDVLAGERDARTIYDIACIREEKHGASREDVEFKAIALRNYQFCAAVAELIEALSLYTAVCGNTCAMVTRETAAEMYAKGTTALANIRSAK